MLNYHIIYSEKRSQNNCEFVHYLSLGSHSSSFLIQHLISFSKITLQPKTSLPQIVMNKANEKQQQKPKTMNSLLIPIYGTVRADNKNYENKGIFECCQTKCCNQVSSVKNGQYLSSGDQQKSVFLYLLIDEDFQTISNDKIDNQKTILTSNNIEAKLYCITDNLSYTTQKDQLIYLQKGKINLKDGNIIKNKGKKSQNNNFCNLVLFKQKMEIQIEKDSIFLSIRIKTI